MAVDTWQRSRFLHRRIGTTQLHLRAANLDHVWLAQPAMYRGGLRRRRHHHHQRRACVVQRGTVSTTSSAPATISTTVTPSAAGPVTAELSWSGAANLNLEIVRISDGQLVASATTNNQPEVATFPITPGTAYRITTRAASGTAEYALSLAGNRNFPTAPVTRRNILIINVDDARPEALEVMPAVRRWFGEQGTEFTNASVSTPACCSSRATTMSGQYDHNNGQRNQNTPSLDENHTIQRNLVDHGYLTGHTGKYLHYYANNERAPYWDRWN